MRADKKPNLHLNTVDNTNNEKNQPNPESATKFRFSKKLIIIIIIVCLLISVVVIVLITTLSQRSAEMPPVTLTTSATSTANTLITTISPEKTQTPIVCFTYNPPLIETVLNNSNLIFADQSSGSHALRNMSGPTGITITPSGDLLITELGTNSLLYYNMSSQRLSPVKIGNGPYTTFDGTFRTYLYPISPQVAVANDGAVYLTSGSVILKLFNDDLTILAGMNGSTSPINGYLGKSSLGNFANLIMNGSKVIVFDRQNHRIRQLNSSGFLLTLTGNGAELNNGALNVAAFNNPTFGVFDQMGNLFLSDTGNNRLRKITPMGMVSQYSAYLPTSPRGLAVDPCGKVLAITSDLNQLKIYQNSTSVKSYRLACNGCYYLAQGQDGSLYIPDFGNNVIRKVRFT